MNVSDEMKLVQAAIDLAAALGNISTTFETLITAGLSPQTHTHTWVFLRQDNTQQPITKERIREVLPPKAAEDQIMYGHNRYYEVCDIYYCAGCPEMRRIHMQDYFISTGTIDGTPHIRFWQKDIREL